MTINYYTMGTVGWLDGWSLTSRFSTNTAISATNVLRNRWSYYHDTSLTFLWPLLHWGLGTPIGSNV